MRRPNKDPARGIIEAAGMRLGMEPTQLRERVHITKSTWSRRMQSPSTLTLGDLRSIVKVTSMKDEDIVEMVRWKG